MIHFCAWNLKSEVQMSFKGLWLKLDVFLKGFLHTEMSKGATQHLQKDQTRMGCLILYNSLFSFFCRSYSVPIPHLICLCRPFAIVYSPNSLAWLQSRQLFSAISNENSRCFWSIFPQKNFHSANCFIIPLKPADLYGKQRTRALLMLNIPCVCSVLGSVW